MSEEEKMQKWQKIKENREKKINNKKDKSHGKKVQKVMECLLKG